MNPRIVHIPLSGGDRKAQAKGLRQAHGLHETYFREPVLIRSAADAKIREAIDWNARPGTRSCGPAGRRCRRQASRRPSRPSGRPSTAGSISWKPSASLRPGLPGRAASVEAAAGDAGLKAGSNTLLRALQRGSALQSPAAGAYIRIDLRPAGSGCPARHSAVETQMNHGISRQTVQRGAGPGGRPVEMVCRRPGRP